MSSRVEAGLGVRNLWRPFLACVAIANLWYLTTWRSLEVLFLEQTSYYRKAPPTLTYFTSVVLSILLVAIALFVVYVAIARWWPRQLRTLAITGAGLLLAVCAYRWPDANVTPRVLKAMVIIAGTALALRFRDRALTSSAGKLLAIASVLFFIQAGSSLWGYFRVTRQSSEFGNDPPAPRQAPQAAQRVVWVVFDELDYELTFPLRPANVQMPELDRLRGESFFATRAFSPTATTTKSFPSLLTGRVVARARPSKVDDAELTFAPNDEAGMWATQRNLFADLRKQGWDAGLVGWHNPYCRVMGDDLADCEWEPNLDAFTSLLSEYVVHRIGLMPVDAVVHGAPRRLMRPGPSEHERLLLLREGLVKQHQVTMTRARRLLRDTSLDLVLIHSLIPHPPGIYNRKSDRIDTNSPANYFDNLELMDRALGELRNELESSGLWDSTTLIVTSDHYLRRFVWAGLPLWTAEEDTLTKKREQPRVPFLIKFARSAQAAVYDVPFNTVLTHDLIPELMGGKVVDAASVSRWFNVNSSRFPAKTLTTGAEVER